jgi:hypothetical protein
VDEHNQVLHINNGYVQVKPESSATIMRCCSGFRPFPRVQCCPWAPGQNTHGVLADDGWHKGPVQRHVQLKLRKPATCLWPNAHTALSYTTGGLLQGDLLSPAQAVKHLMSGHLNRPAFTVLTCERSEQSGDNETPGSSWFRNSKMSFRHPLAELRAMYQSAFRCNRMLPNPIGHPSDCLPLRSKSKCMKCSKRVAPSGFAYWAPVLFVRSQLDLCECALTTGPQQSHHQEHLCSALLRSSSGLIVWCEVLLLSGLVWTGITPRSRNRRRRQ